MVHHYTLKVYGRVQGVGFRLFVLSQAQQLHVTGTVQNMPDGSVLIEAEGPKEAMAALVRLVKVGPAGAKVTKVEKKTGVYQGYLSFEIV